MKAISLTLLLLLLIVAGVFYLLPDNSGISAKTDYSNEAVRISVTSNQEAAVAMSENSFTLQLTDAAGQPIRQANLKVQLLMPKMYCGIIMAQVSEQTPGSYLIKGIPVMQGKWNAEISLRIADQLIRVDHPFIVKS
ncbi:FixH family protein [Cohnella herbarum]|uniref:YtkA-like domain-containing protein n=1 Tax=Cohnella herbarum TaxID=2728023 RepID=A0A7Z2VHA7_9BACL|nr:FixH family protein [Cohnella herbarum]QJD83087.1 hypothetical protein HH215_07810 [Cohnella herbarum]